jgi:hypothetical protein
MAAANVNEPEDGRLFRTVTALGAELRRQGAWSSAGKIDLVDLAHAAIGASRHQARGDEPDALRAKAGLFPRVLKKYLVGGAG